MDVSFSRIKTFNRCPMRHHYRYDLHLKRKVKALPLKRGSALHLCLEELYSKGNYTKALKGIKKDYNNLFEEEKELYGDLPGDVERIMLAYKEEYQDDLDNWEVLTVEEHFGYPLMTSKNGQEFILTGVMDLTVREGKHLWVVDHKSVKTIPETAMSLVDLQTTLYYYVKQEQGEKPQGVMLNYLRTKSPTIPQVLKNGTISKRKIDTTRGVYLKAILDAGEDPRDYEDILDRCDARRFFARQRLSKPDVMVKQLLEEVKRASLRIAAELTPIRSIQNSCSWDCDYKNLCLTALQGGDVDSVMEMDYTIDREVIDDGDDEEEGTD